jgi:septum formation protein
MTLQTLLKNKRIILASASPRRRQLMEGLDIQLEIISFPDHDETYPDGLKEKEVAEYLAVSKAKHFLSRYTADDNTIIITADTIVWYENRVLNKPVDANDAYTMLKKLSGKTHEVYTGVCITYKNHHKVFSSLSEVEFAALEDDEIKYYIDTYKPYDKAGSYGAQEWIGYVAIKRIEGSFFNVMGLPIRQVYAELKEMLKNG